MSLIPLILPNTYHNVDSLSLDGMARIKSKSISLIIADLPFGTTANKWDTIIPLNDFMEIEEDEKVLFLTKEQYYLSQYKIGIAIEKSVEVWESEHKKGLWYHYDRILKHDGVVLFFSQKPFGTLIHNSNMEDFRYEWIWEKTHATGFQNSHKMPLKSHENVLVFYKKLPYYNPQKTNNHPRKVSSAISQAKSANNPKNYNKHTNLKDYDSTDRFPKSIITISKDTQFSSLHPTQKPSEIYEYFIRTYTQEDDIILDNCSGSGTLAIACENVGDRSFICMEKDTTHGYYEDSVDRLKIHKVLREYVKVAMNTSSHLFNDIGKTRGDIVKSIRESDIYSIIEPYRKSEETMSRLTANVKNIIKVYERSGHAVKGDDGFYRWVEKRFFSDSPTHSSSYFGLE